MCLHAPDCPCKVTDTPWLLQDTYQLWERAKRVSKDLLGAGQETNEVRGNSYLLKCQGILPCSPCTYRKKYRLHRKANQIKQKEISSLRAWIQ